MSATPPLQGVVPKSHMGQQINDVPTTEIAAMECQEISEHSSLNFKERCGLRLNVIVFTGKS